MEVRQRASIAGNSVVPVVAQQLAPEGCLLRPHGFVPVALTPQGTTCSDRLSRSDAVFPFTTHDPLRKRVANPGVYGLGSALRSVGAGGGGGAAGHLAPSGAFIDPSYLEALEYLAMPHFHERRYDLKSCS